MLSQAAEKAIEFSRKYLKPAQREPFTPEMVQGARKSADEGNPFSFPAGVTLEEVASPVKGEFYRLEQKKLQDTVLLFLHGGAYATGTVKSRRGLAVKLGQLVSCDVFAVDYTQYPEGRHPAAQNDVEAAYAYLRERYSHILVFGESAGATLSLTLTLSLKEKGEKLPDRLALFSPVISQLSILTSEYLNDDRDPMLVGAGDPVPYFTEPAKKDPLISPIYGDFQGFPPMMINCGSEEVKLDHSLILNYLATKAGVDTTLKVWPGLFHVFVLFDMPESDQAVKQIADFLRKD